MPLKKLEKIAEDNTRVTKGTKINLETIKFGVPNDHSRKHLSDEVPVVGASLGITKNMENYESLRVDCWLTDRVREGETEKDAYDRIIGILDKTLNKTVQAYL